MAERDTQPFVVPIMVADPADSAAYLSIEDFVQAVNVIVDKAEATDVAALKEEIKRNIADAVSTVQVRLFT